MKAQPSPWVAPDWWAEAERWTRDRLGALGRSVTGPITLFRRRSWSVMLTVATDAGRHWIKQNCPSQAFEARLLAALSEVSPDRVLTPLDVDEATGRMVTADQGPTLRDRGPADAATWIGLLTDYGQLQRETAEALTDADLGLTILRPAEAPAYLDQWVDFWRGQPESEGRMSDEIATRLADVRPALTRWADEVASLGLPLTVEHSDLHDNNAFAPRVAGRPPQVFDFGDASVGCPLSSLLVPIRSFGESGLDQAEQDRIVDAYLEVWSDLAPPADLRAALPAALNLGVLGRHESWRRTIGWSDPEDPYGGEFGDAPVQWLNLLNRPLS